MDQSGIVMEVKDYDQHVVKIAGSGRLTLRNRQFLRKFVSHDLYHSHHVAVTSPGTICHTPIISAPLPRIFDDQPLEHSPSDTPLSDPPSNAAHPSKPTDDNHIASQIRHQLTAPEKGTVVE